MNNEFFEKITNKSNDFDIAENSYFVSVLIAVIIFMQNSPWILWDYYYYVLVLSVLVLNVMLVKRFLIIKKAMVNYIPFFFILIVFFVLIPLFYEFRISSFITILVFINLFFITDSEKINAADIFTKVLSIIVLVSLAMWLFHNNVSQLPSIGQLGYSEVKGDGGSTILNNYIFFIEVQSADINRFYSVFDEPGVLGTLSAFLLCINKYDFRKGHNIILLLGGIFTFSLAFFIMTLLGYFLYNLKNIYQLIKSILVLLILFVVGYFFLRDDPTFQVLIIGRLFDLDGSGVSSRTSDALNIFYDKFVGSFDFIFGMGTDFFTKNPSLLSGQGYKIFLIEYGLFGLLLVFIIYLSQIKKLSKANLVLLLLFFISFLQRPFLFTPYQIALFSIGIVKLNSDE
jgi:hypothetical protein